MATYVYTLSSVGRLFEWAFLSIRTLTRYVDASDVTVFFTPPREDDHVDRLDALGVDVRTVENSTDAFVAFDAAQHYGEKTWLSTIDDETVVFLDCDTLVLGDVRSVVAGDFEFKARPGTSQVRQPEWRELFDRFDEPYLDWMPNAGFLVFKEGLHWEIGESWRSYVQTDLDYRHNVNHKEQYALALAVGGADVERMTAEEHVMLWNNECPPEGVVYHAGNALEGDASPDTFHGSVAVGIKQLLRGNV